MQEKIKIEDVYQVLAQPGIRALHSIGVTSIEILCDKTERELLTVHGFGKSGLARIKNLLQTHGLSLKD